MADVQPGAPSAPAEPTSSLPPAVAAAVASDDVAAFRAAERQERLTPTPPAASSAATPVEQAVSTETIAPPSEAAKPSKPKSNAESRIQELLAERAQLRRELDLRSQPPPDAHTAESSPAPAAAPKFPEYAAYLATNPDASLEQWLDARDDWRDARRDAIQSDQARTEALTQAQHARAQKFTSQIEASTHADPAFLSKVSADVLELRPIEALQPGQAAGPRNVIGSELLTSPIAPQLMTHWSEHPEDLLRLETVPEHLRALPLAERAREHVRWMVREIGKLEARLESPLSSTPTHKSVTAAPAPPPTLGSRPSAAADPIADAVDRDDVAAFRAASRAERLALGR